MAKKKKKEKISPQPKTSAPPSLSASQSPSAFQFFSGKKNQTWIVAALAFALYANTLFNQFTLDDGMVRRTEMFGGVLVGRVVAAADVAARSTQPEMNPDVARPEAFFAASSAWCHLSDACQVSAWMRHWCLPRPV